MTVPATSRRAGPFLGNGSTTAFPFTFKTTDATEVQVVKLVSGIETTLVKDSDYTVTLNVDQDATPGGTITYPIVGAPLATGETLTIAGQVPYSQDTDLPPGGKYAAQVVENALDRIVAQVQQLAEGGERSLRLPLSSASASTELPAPEANKFIGWNETASALQNIDPITLATIVAFGTADYLDAVGDGVTTAFTLPSNPGALANLDVAVGGVVQRPVVDYNWPGGTTLTFTSAPAIGVTVFARYLQALPQGTSSSDVVTHQRDVGFPTETVYAEARRALWVDEIYPGGFNPSTTDASTYINQVLLWAEANGNPEVRISGRRHCLSAQSVAIPDFIDFGGQGRGKTELFLMAGANKELVTKKAGASGVGAALRRMSLNGNDANNLTGGGFFWNNTVSVRGPSIHIEEVLFNYMRASAASGTGGAVVIQGSTWGVMRDVDIDQNQYAIGLWHKGSDWIFDDLFMGPNGALANAGAGGQNVIIQGGAGNIFTAAYFGGNGGYEQVLLWGSQRNEFIGCWNDNSWQDGYRFADSGGLGASYNTFTGGQISHAGGRTANVYAGVSLEGQATGNVFTGVNWIGDGHTSSLNKAKYAVYETGTATENQVLGGWTGNNYGTQFNGMRGAGSSSIRAVQGYNPQGAAAVTVTASPFTYTNQDNVPEILYVSGGTVSGVTKNALAVASATNCAVQLDPGEAMTVTYTVLPTINKDRR